jgi:hypothetical protein
VEASVWVHVSRHGRADSRVLQRYKLSTWAGGGGGG